MLFFILIALFLACKNKEVKINDNSKSMNETGIPVNVLIDSIENYGSVDAFELLQIESLEYPWGRFLPTFRIMADKYENSSACMEVYNQIVSMNNLPVIGNSNNGIYLLESLDIDAKKMAIRYLVKADSLGNQVAKDHIEEYIEIGLLK